MAFPMIILCGRLVNASYSESGLGDLDRTVSSDISDSAGDTARAMIVVVSSSEVAFAITHKSLELFSNNGSKLQRVWSR